MLFFKTAPLLCAPNLIIATIPKSPSARGTTGAELDGHLLCAMPPVFHRLLSSYRGGAATLGEDRGMQSHSSEQPSLQEKNHMT